MTTIPAVPAEPTRLTRFLETVRRWWCGHVAECRCAHRGRETWSYQAGAFVGRCLDCGGPIVDDMPRGAA